jgi:hypothetical protein
MDGIFVLAKSNTGEFHSNLHMASDGEYLDRLLLTGGCPYCRQPRAAGGLVNCLYGA